MSLALSRPDLGFQAVDDGAERSRAGDGPPLHYRWHEGLASLRNRAYAALPYERIESALAIGDEFIELYAAQAEAFGCQPVHILKPPAEGRAVGGGLAWRWTIGGMKPLAFAPRILVAGFSLRSPVAPFVYRLEATGDVTMLYDEERRAALFGAGLGGEVV